MAVSHTIVQQEGNPVRSTMSLVNMDGNATFLTGTSIGLTVGTTDAAGDDVHVANEQAFVSGAELTALELMSAWAEKITAESGGVAGARAYIAQNTDDEYVMHIEAQYSSAYPAQNVVISLPTFVPGT